MEQPMRNLGPVPPAPPLAGTPPPTYPSALHRSLSDIHDLLQKLNQFLQTFAPNYIVTGDGKKVETLTRTEIGVSTAGSLWFSVTNTSEGDTFTVHVNEGRILGPDTSGLNTDPPTVAGLLKEYTVDAADLDVEDGSVIYLKLAVTTGSHTFTVNGNDPDDFVDITVSMLVTTFSCVAGELVAQTTAPTPSASEAFITIAEIEITDGVMSILPRHTGAVPVPALVAPTLNAATVTSFFSTADYWTCNNGTAEEVTFIVPS